jgi:4,5-DOPA dioxygenase extradiol
MKKANSSKIPVLFIGHGSPINMILKNDYTESLVTLEKELLEPRTILVTSI